MSIQNPSHADSLRAHLLRADPRRFWTAARGGMPPVIPLADPEEVTRRSTALRTFVHEALFAGPGYCVLRLDGAQALPDEALAAFADRLADLTGKRMVQTEDGQRSFNVTRSDRAEDGRHRLSLSADDTALHTDCSYGDERPDAISLFCVHPAAEGGESLLASAYTALSAYLEAYPQDEAPLFARYFFHRSHLQYPDQPPFGIYPMLDLAGDALAVRYKAPYMVMGYADAGRAVPQPVSRFLERFEAIAADNAVRLTLERGDCLVANNLWILHNRTPYRDGADVPRRLMIRHWMRTAAPVDEISLGQNPELV